VQSITADGIETTATAPAAARRRPLLGGLVLPRILRRPARMLQKANWRLPRYAGTAGLVLLVGATVGAGVVAGGHALDVASAVTAWSGLALEEVRITGQSRTEELDVLQKLAIGPLPSLATFDLDAARARIETLPWVADVGLRKLYPHNLDVVIREKRPFAVWQDGDALWLIDEKGTPITNAVDARYAKLPMVVGKGAASRIGEFSALIAAAPALAQRTRAGVLIAERRWTLVLDNGVEVMLPENDPTAALVTAAQLDAASGVLSRAVVALDLRETGQVVVRLDAEGVAAHAALLKGRAKSTKAKA
jgi:cell division protein FtsQ